MSVGESKISEDGGRPASEQGPTGTNKANSNDHLRQFYVDVLLPLSVFALHYCTVLY